MTEGAAELPHDPRAVVETYDEIAPHFADKRKNPWPEVTTFLEDAHAGTALDIGCANGRHTELLASVAERTIGLDASRELLHEATARQVDHGFEAMLVQGDAGRQPIQADSVDLALYVATMHHLPNRQARIESLDELARVLRRGGRGLVSVWSTEHDRFDETEGFDTTVTFTLPDGTAVPRFYHIYDPEEFEDDLAASSVSVEREFVSNGNCYAVVNGSQ